MLATPPFRFLRLHGPQALRFASTTSQAPKSRRTAQLVAGGLVAGLVLISAQLYFSPAQAPVETTTREQRRAKLPPVESIVNLRAFESLAREVLGSDDPTWRSYAAVAEDGISYKLNQSSFSHLRFLPRVNIPVEQATGETSFLGAPVSFPFLFSPAGWADRSHPDGDKNFTRVSATSGIPQILSNGSDFNAVADERDRILANGGGEARLWAQFYIHSDRQISERDLQTFKKRGAQAIVLTVDTVAIAKRELDENLVQTRAAYQKLRDPNPSWDDIAWIKSHAPGIPILVKGISTVEDTILAKSHGAAGVFLSNHGGRQLDHTPPPLATLIRLHYTRPDLLNDPSFEVYLDGGVWRGTDILKAVSLGARGVGVGRVGLYAQAAYGQAGLDRVISILADEFHTGLKLLGARNVSELKPELLELLPGLVGKRLGTPDRV